MEEHDHGGLIVHLIDEETTFTLAELCRSCAVDAELVEDMVEHGILDPVGEHRGHWYFSSTSLRRTRITARLQRDLGVNLAGAALALELLDRIDELEARMRTADTDQE